MYGTPGAHILESKHSLIGDQRYGDVAGKQGIEQVLRQLAHGAVEEFDGVVAGVKARQL